MRLDAKSKIVAIGQQIGMELPCTAAHSKQKPTVSKPPKWAGGAPNANTKPKGVSLHQIGHFSLAPTVVGLAKGRVDIMGGGFVGP